MGKKEIFIVGGGPSLREFDFSKLENKNTITVNKSIFDVPSPNYFITVDFIFTKKVKNRIDLFNSIKTTKVFVADMHFEFIQERAGQIIDIRNNRVYELNEFDLIIKAKKAEGIGYTFSDFRTGLNSGYCGLQLAVILGYEKIYLLGMDLNRGHVTHYHGGYGEPSGMFNKKIPIYIKEFQRGLAEIKKDGRSEVISCSSTSSLNKSIPYQDIEKIL